MVTTSATESILKGIARHTFTVEQYYQMAEVGILDITKGTELIEGEIIDMSPMGRLHAACIAKATRLLIRLLPDSLDVRVQLPIHLSNLSEPQPDLAIVRYREDYYASGHPQHNDILLLIEVSDSTLKYDREVKLPLYAKYDIPEVWIVNLEDRLLEVYRQVGENGYEIVRDYQRGEVVNFGAAEKIAIAINQIL
ncbi:Uma2 family endonuclease [Tumidithrix elongata RA019]|uniref:Uma2 family endonuclease n=1 Tax=Tumidithrix elongata BACA0141 TaxID=2716417 RepID=A0AAW9PR22_9CYAN|nr:Uma2 family endonuclease [Tumidithrix elongata RA019]